MAVAHVRGSGMTSSEKSNEASSVSSLKEETEYIFPDNLVMSVVPGTLDEGDRASLQRKIKEWEKDNLIQRKARGEIAGAIRDTRSRFGPPKEWDHLQFSLDREESELYGLADLTKMRNIIRDIAAKDMTGDYRKMVITRIHTDTGNSHIDLFVHRHPFSVEKNETKGSEELTGRSFLPMLIQKINEALVAADLPFIKDTKTLDGQSLYQESATSDQAKQLLNTMVHAEGGIPSQRTGTPVVPGDDEPRPERQRIQDPDAKQLERALLDAEREAKAATQKLVSLQNAVEAQRQRAELQARIAEAEALAAEQEAAIEAARIELAERDAAAAALNANIEQLNEREAGLRSEIESLSNTITEQTGQITGLTDDYENLQSELTQRDAQVVSLQGEVADREGQITALQGELFERDGTISRQAEQIATHASTIESLGQQLDQANGVIASQAEEIAARDATIGKLGSEVEGVRAQLATAKETIATQGEKIETLRSEVQQRDVSLAKASGQIEVLSAQIGTLTTERDNFRVGAEKKSEELQKMTANHQALQKHSGDMMEKFKELRNLHNTILNAVARYVPEDTKTDLREAIRSLLDQYVGLTNNDARAQAKVKDLEALVSKVQTENEQMRTIIDQIREGGTGEGGTGGDPPPSI